MNNTHISDINIAFSNLGKAARSVVASMLVLQSELLCATLQPSIAFYKQADQPDDRQLYQDRINYALHCIRDHASFYQNTLIKDIIRRITDIDSYFNAQNILSETMLPAFNHSQIIQQLKSVLDIARLYRSEAEALSAELDDFRRGLINNACQCDSATKNLNAVMSGDRSTLSSIGNQLAGLDAKLSRTIEDCLRKAIARSEISFSIMTGNIAELYTTSMPTYLVLGGGAIISQGEESVTSDAIHQASLLKRKNELLNQEAGLHNEVMLSLGITAGLNKLSSDTKALQDSVKQLATCWDALVLQFEHLIEQAGQQHTAADRIQRQLISAARGDIRYIQQDVEIALTQLATIDYIEELDMQIDALLIRQVRQEPVIVKSIAYAG